MSTIGVITSSYSITQEEFEAIDFHLEVKTEEYDNYIWESELIMTIKREGEEETPECQLYIDLYYEAANGRRFSTRLMEKNLWCSHHQIYRTPADDPNFANRTMQNDNKKRKRKEPSKSTSTKRRRPSTSNANVNEVDGHQASTCQENGINDNVITEFKEYLGKSATFTQLRNFLSSVILENQSNFFI